MKKTQSVCKTEILLISKENFTMLVKCLFCDLCEKGVNTDTVSVLVIFTRKSILGVLQNTNL